MPLMFELLGNEGRLVAVLGELTDLPGDKLPEVSYNDYPLLAGVDRFGRTVFNTTQMEHLESEVERLFVSLDATSRAASLARGLIDMCRQGKSAAHWQLVVTGD